MRQLILIIAIFISSFAAAQEIKISAIAGEQIDSFMLVYFAADGRMFKADNAVLGKEADAYCPVEIEADKTGDAYLHGVVPYPTGSNIIGTILYLSGSTAGTISTTRPTGAFQVVGMVQYGDEIALDLRPRLSPTWTTNRITSTSSPQDVLPNIDNLVDQGSTQASFTFTMPASPNEGDTIEITFNNAVTVLTIDGNGNSVGGTSITSSAIGTNIVYKWYVESSTWIRKK